MSHSSTLELYGEGVVAVHKPIDSRDITVTAEPLTGFIDGELSDNYNTIQPTVESREGHTSVNTTHTSNVLTATWLPMGSNRRSAPDMRAGERVFLYRMAGTNRYFWVPRGDDDHLRKLESVIYVYAANPNESVHEVGIDSCYFFEIDTRNGMVTFSTSMANGEATRYLTQYNTKQGTFVLKDIQGNYVHIDSQNALIEFINAAGSKVIMNGADGEFIFPGNLTVRVDGNHTTIVKGSSATKATDISMDGGGSTLNINGGAIAGNAPSYSWA